MNGMGDAPKKRGRKSQAKTALVTAVDYLARQAQRKETA